MKAILDHVGIAVTDLAAALQFYRESLGLEVEGVESVETQRVRAHFIPVGGAALELLEATSPESAIAKYTSKRGPGLHHITLRVENIDGALAQLKDRGVRLIDERARPGAEGARVAFIHPASAHGVLVELKQGAAAHVFQAEAVPLRFALGDLELISLSDGFFRLDGGSMFGIVPRPLWSAKAPPDDRNRIRLAMRPLVVRGVRTMLIDAGVGDKDDEKFREIYGVERGRHLEHSLAAAGIAPEDVDIVLATHLHFDHAGGFTVRDRSGALRPRFPRARYVIRRGEWEDATHPHERNRGSYLADNFIPLLDAGVLELVSDDQAIMPGVRVRHTGGHTAHHQMAVIESAGHRAVYVADVIPTSAHLPPAWVMGFDLYPMDTLAAKKALIQEAETHRTLILLPHDPAVAAGYLTRVDGKPRFEPAQA